MVLSELSTFVTYCQMIFKNTVESGIIMGRSSMSFLLDHLLAEIVAYSNLIIVRTDVKTSSSIH